MVGFQIHLALAALPFEFGIVDGPQAASSAVLVHRKGDTTKQKPRGTTTLSRPMQGVASRAQATSHDNKLKKELQEIHERSVARHNKDLLDGDAELDKLRSERDALKKTQAFWKNPSEVPNFNLPQWEINEKMAQELSALEDVLEAKVAKRQAACDEETAATKQRFDKFKQVYQPILSAAHLAVLDWEFGRQEKQSTQKCAADIQLINEIYEKMKSIILQQTQPRIQKLEETELALARIPQADQIERKMNQRMERKLDTRFAEQKSQMLNIIKEMDDLAKEIKPLVDDWKNKKL